MGNFDRKRPKCDLKLGESDPKLTTILDYIYHNSIYWHAPGSNEPREVFAWKCTYEDKYSVSLDFAIKPVERTLQFVTEKGKFDVQMKVYEDETFAPQYEVNFTLFDHF